MSEKTIIDINSKYRVSSYIIKESTTLFDTSDIYIICCKNGCGEISINNNKYMFENNSSFAASFSDHCTIIPSVESNIIIFEFSLDILNSDFGKIIPIDSFPAEITVADDDKETINKLVEMLLEEQSDADEYTKIYFSGLFEQIVVCLLSNLAEMKIINSKIRKAVVYIYENFRTGITKEEVAKVAGISYQSFSGEFYKHLGVHFKEYLNNIRLNYSMKLIRCTDMNFTDICYECGFNSSQYFSHMFKENFGVSPKNIRKENVNIV